MAGITTDLSLNFLCGLRGYHVYQTVWTPRLNEVLSTEHKRNNLYDRHAIAAKKKLPGRISNSIIGHLPKEISRITQYIILYGAVVTLKVCDTHYRRSPLVQGGLEIPVKVEVKLECSEKNRLAIAKYQSLVGQLYREPVDGIFEDATASILQEVGCDVDEDEFEDEENPADEEDDVLTVTQNFDN